MLNTTIGTGIRSGGISNSQSWSSYWATLNKTFYSEENTRNGSVLPNSVNIGVSDATILQSHLKKADGNEYGYIADNAALDIFTSASNYTFAMWIKSEVDVHPAAFFVYGGKYTASSVNGKYGFYCGTDSKLACMVYPASGIKNMVSNVVMTDKAWHFALMEIDKTNLKIRFFVDNVQIGADENYTGAWLALSNLYEFYIGCANGTSGSGVTYISKASFSDTYIYHKLLTPTEKTTLFNKGFVSGSVGHWPCNSISLNDVSGNGRDLTGVVLSKVGYSTYGSRQCLDKGYSLYKKLANIDVYVPYTNNGVKIQNPNVPADYIWHSDYSGDLSNHNLADSKIRVPLTAWDRSNVTIYTDSARGTVYPSFYDSSNPNDWHIGELNKAIMDIYTNTNHDGLIFPKMTISSTKYREKLLELFSLSANISGTELVKILSHTNDLIKNKSLCFVGDSTMGTHSSGASLQNFFRLYTDYTTHSIATTGDRIFEQKDKWDLISVDDKLTYDFVFIQIGLNDLAASVAGFAADYQALVNKIRGEVKIGCKIIGSTMTPCYQFFINANPVTAAAVLANWLLMNEAISGTGANAITGLDYVNLNNTIDLNDGTQRLAALYNSGDGLHPNNIGRLEIYNNYLFYLI